MFGVSDPNIVVPERCPKNVPERCPKDVPERCPKDVPERCPKDVPGCCPKEPEKVNCWLEAIVVVSELL